MNKTSYISRPSSARLVPLGRSDTPLSPGSYDLTSEDGMPEGSRGMSMPLESSQVPLYKSNEFEEIAPKDMIDKNHEINGFEELSRILLELSDGLDSSREYKIADFADFLIIKIAESNTKNYEKLFRLAIISIANSDIINSNKVISNAVARYSNMMLGGASSADAYSASIKDLFLIQDNINKNAQILEMNPSYVADQLHKIIKIMLAKISPEKRGGSFKNVADKLSDFNVLEISNKKAPGGAAIGASLGLVKNVLNSKNSYFVNVVLKELIKRL